tara:strand:- start:10282 stop:11004 length:723 start_codon:yes stop_codon:yes gene_type:complete
METEVYTSYLFTTIALAGTGFVTALESIRAPDPAVKGFQHLTTALQVETVVNIIASIVYMVILKRVEKNPNDKMIMKLRYADWFLTTPLLLFSLSLYMGYEANVRSPTADQNDHTPNAWLLLAVAFNFAMLLFGYVSEDDFSPKGKALAFLGFLSLGGVFATIGFTQYVFVPEFSWDRVAVFAAVIAVWLLYGVAHFLEPNKRSIMYNSLDLIAKVGFGFFLYVFVRLFYWPTDVGIGSV